MILSASTQQRKHQKGFTLVELMVSVALFSIVVTVSMGTLITMIDANNKAQALYSVMTNLSFAVDSMTRNIRTGYSYYCITEGMSLEYDAFNVQDGVPPSEDCDSPGKTLIFSREIDGSRTGYRYHEGDKAIQQNVGGNPSSWINITADDVEITRLEFITQFTDTINDTNQPRVAIFIEGSVAGQRGAGADFAIQTNVMQQIIDYE